VVLKAGLYQHYKGPLYRVFEVARHSETDESLVVYRALYGEGGLWVRPLSMFVEDLEYQGKLVARFGWCEDQRAAEQELELRFRSKSALA
jgi:hypothetical protein